MPRYKRKSRYYRKKSTSNDDNYSSNHASGGVGMLTPAERALLRKYLLEYKNGCQQVCFPLDYYSDEETVVTAPAAKSSNSEAGVEICGSTFPAFTEQVLSQPYLALPTTLTSKQRRVIHELCVDVDLYHCGVGATRDDRYIAISIHSDGLDHVPELKNGPPNEARIPVRQLRPWFHRTDHASISHQDENEDTPQRGSKASIHPHIKQQTKKARDEIEALIDQPGTCLRDTVDTIDFHQMDGQDLSSISPPGLGPDDSWMLVDSADKMKQCAQELHDAHPTEVAFDMEMYNPSKYTQVTCLIQITSNATKEYVIDTLAPGVWEHVSLLAPLFADPTIVKVGHSIGGMDVPSLHRDFGIFCVNAFDTHEASKVLKTRGGNGLAVVCEAHGLTNVERYKELKEQYQKTDWRVRPLTDEMIQYGRYDVHYLLALRKLMIRDLTREELWDNVGANKEAERRMIAKALASTIKRIEREEDGDDDTFSNFENAMAEASSSSLDTSMASRLSSFSDDDDGYFTPPAEEDPNDDTTRRSAYHAQDLRMQPDLMKVITQSQQRCLDLWSSKTESPTKNGKYISVIYRAGKGELEWTPSHMALYDELYAWRETVAKREQVLPGLVCPLDWLVDIAVKRPPCEASLRHITYYLPPVVEGSKEILLDEILAMVRSSLEKDGLSTTSTVQKYSVPRENEGSRRSRGRRLVLSLVAIAAVGGAAAFVVTTLRKRRR